ncbi:type IIA DNA topoisomerase subunit B ['Fragaria x ananassa' phyllody phytoplasma]|uniref:DNA topoisomerase (ATP-hydrolyzing) n=1 Tax='Fragaria x ananassa' phyllody phytoplasma TaxID=2358428 RepID=A0ABS5K4K0_9MOLU|nr:DNA topoisomerase subunit B ['Fragaria x ananassa' phyllody phytoplasma]MBS2126170.1 type IIA DNA topoisomerase subunit B ['Fragaria x ananassa' phyllody phytoplasma]
MKKYNADSIQILEGLEAVRKRPGMYIGSTAAKGLHHLVWEIIDNSIDEALAGHANEITLEIMPGDVISVTDDGRGIPVGIHPKTGKPAVETILTTLHAGGKFDGSVYKISGGLHGVGASVVNALSSWFTVEIHLDKKIHYQKYEKGVAVTPLEIVGKTNRKGTIIKFLADPKIFKETTVYNLQILKDRLQQLSFLNKKLKLNLIDNRKDEAVSFSFYHEAGLQDYLNFIDQTHHQKCFHDIFYLEKELPGLTLEVAFEYTVDQKNKKQQMQESNKDVETDDQIVQNYTQTQKIYSFVNNIHTHEGGTHEEGFKLALNRNISKYAKEFNLLKKDEHLMSEDILEGITAIISLKHQYPQFEGQTKAKLGNVEVRAIVSQLFGEFLEKFLLEHPQSAKKIIDKCLLSANARLAAKRAREITRNKPLDSLGFASKLADCRSKDPQVSELYIVEGDSAGGSAKQGRDSRFQAILPLRGKVLNVEKTQSSKILTNKEIKSLIQAIGVGVNVGKTKEIPFEKIRYHKIIIMTDADVDGAHIRTLLLTFFFRNFRVLIDKGYIYFARPPLYKYQKGKNITYFYEEKHKQTFALQKNIKEGFQRYKGLGEMNPDQLWETTMNPETRTLLKATLQDALTVLTQEEAMKEADQTFNTLMGKKVLPRKNFILAKALEAELDV